MRSRAVIPIVIAVLAFGWWVGAPYGRREASPSATVAAPDFIWQGLDGSSHRLTELSGHAVVLHFWASWCAPCREEFPKLLAAAQAMPDIIFLTVSSDEDRASAERFIRRMQQASHTKNLANVQYAFDPQKTLTFDIFQTAQYPESITLDTAHHLRRKFSEAVDWNSKDVRNYLRQLSTPP